MDPKGAVTGVQSVQRTFALLERMGASGGEAGISELATDLGVALPTAHRLIRTLTKMGYVRQLPSRRYALGPSLALLGGKASGFFAEWARPVLSRLEAKINETANLATLDGDMVTYIGQVPGRRQMRMFIEVGKRVPLHSTGVGKAILAQLDDDKAIQLLQGNKMLRYTETTIVDFEAMRQELALIRGRGYAVDEGEQEMGVRCYAMGVPGAVVPMAVSVSGPTSRMTAERESSIVASLRAAALELSGVLGGGLNPAPIRPNPTNLRKDKR
ncbi:IclR family transcriptional regulator [Arthrobacter sp. NPDC058130]|uniref:IclR family transcriptional regulator n=1 Tax=Arthrobacter sp. NPDC058130 TaxID=3346353 RepID=UPI0036EC17D7